MTSQCEVLTLQRDILGETPVSELHRITAALEYAAKQTDHPVLRVV